MIDILSKTDSALNSFMNETHQTQDIELRDNYKDISFWRYGDLSMSYFDHYRTYDDYSISETDIYFSDSQFILSFDDIGLNYE